MTTSPSTPRVWAVMTRDVITLAPTTTIAAAADALHRHHLARLPVVNEHMEVVGQVRHSDLLGCHHRTVAQVMTRPALTMEEEAPIAEAVEVLLHQRVRSVPVICNGRLVGRISRTGLVSFLARHEWVCPQCGSAARGVQPPAGCPACHGAADQFRWEDAVPGM